MESIGEFNSLTECSMQSQVGFRLRRRKVEKSDEEFKEHERTLMSKRTEEINSTITKKMHTLWTQFLSPIPKPLNLRMNFVFRELDDYLSVCDNYQSSQHKDSKQKWWNNQKASEMSNGFLPAVLDATDQMAHYLGRMIDEPLRVEFTKYCKFELLETVITSVFSTQRSGSNEVFLRTSFQYSKSELRRKLLSYFEDHELKRYQIKELKKKNSWCEAIKDKKERFFVDLRRKRERLDTESKHLYHGEIGPLSVPPIVEQPVNTVRGAVPRSVPDILSSTLPPPTFPVVGGSTEYLASPPLLMPYDRPRYQFGQALSQSSPLGLSHGPHGVYNGHHLPLKQQSAMESVHGMGSQHRSPIMNNEQYALCGALPEVTGNAFHSKLQCNSNGNGNRNMYGHHRMMTASMQCSGCSDKQRLIDNLRREINVLRQQYQVPPRHDLVHNQSLEGSTVCFPQFPWPQTECDQRMTH